MPTPTAAATAIGSRSAGAALETDRSDDDGGDEHRRAEAVDPAHPAVLGDAVGEDDVGREQGGVREGERPHRLALDAHVGQQIDTGDGRARATALRAVRIPTAASAMTGRNSIAATVPSGRRSMAM